MATRDKQGLLLGKQTSVVDRYAPELLYPIPRAPVRKLLGFDNAPPFYGVDRWHLYELSWLDSNAKPVVRIGRVSVPASSPNLVESKSFKLYLNSLNNIRFDSQTELAAVICRDVRQTVGSDIELELFALDDASLSGALLPGRCLDDVAVDASDDLPSADMLQRVPGPIIEERLYSHLLRSLCPVTGQPDWASVSLHYRGAALDHASLLRYIIAYRRQQEFHEQCVERMFRDLSEITSPEFLHIQAFYTRRGGLDINPFRSSDPAAEPLPRLNRQ